VPIDVTASLINPQQMEIHVSGPDDANRLFMCMGSVKLEIPATGGVYGFSVGPTLTRHQFVQAIATAGSTLMGSSSAGLLHIAHVDADWDDEGRRVQVEVEVKWGGGAQAFNAYIAYQVNILAEMPTN
jgi:hypothetical protein